MRGVNRGVMRGGNVPRHILPYRAFAADFDGTNDWFELSGGHGASDTKVGIVYLWVELDAADGVDQRILSSQTAGFIVYRKTSNKFSIYTEQPGGSTIALWYESASTYLAGSTAWLHLLLSYDTANDKKHLVINGVDDLGTVTNFVADALIDYTDTLGLVGVSNNTGSLILNGGLAEIYVNTAEYMDITVEANYRKFISAAGKPAPLGPDGSIPTGSQPSVYLRDPFGSFETNYGSLGDFTVVGALTARATSPSD